MRTDAMRWLPPSAATRLAATIVAVLVLVAIGAALLLGEAAGIAAALGGINVVVLSLMTGPRWHSAAFGLVIAALASAATVVSAPWAVGLLTAASVIASLQVVIRYGPVCATAPVVVAVAGTEAASLGPAPVFAGAALAALAAPVAVAILGLARMSPAPLARRAGFAYVGALALGSGLAIGVALALEVAHALWLVVALSAVLVPVHGETRSRARRRIAGTVLGTLAAAVAASFLPAWVAFALAVVAGVLGVAWAIVRDQTRSAALVAGALVLVAGVSSTDAAWDVAIQRVGLTALGVALAVVLAMGLARLERREAGEGP